jgi:hypothetical protein
MDRLDRGNSPCQNAASAAQKTDRRIADRTDKSVAHTARVSGKFDSGTRPLDGDGRYGGNSAIGYPRMNALSARSGGRVTPSSRVGSFGVPPVRYNCKTDWCNRGLFTRFRMTAPSLESLAAVQRQLSMMFVGDAASLRVAERLVKKSAWWYDHPQGKVRAPKHCERIANGVHGLQLEFGANKFLVEHAMRLIHHTFTYAVCRAVECDDYVDAAEIRNALALNVRQSVAGFDDLVFNPYSGDDGEFLHLGASEIRVSDVVEEVYRMCELHRVCR